MTDTDLFVQMRSFNFLASSYQHLNEQYYKICIRREERYCRIGYTASSDPDSFKISRNPTGATSYQANNGEGGCGPDTLKIPEGSNYGDKANCVNPVGTVPTVDFYCGGSLNCVTGQANGVTIISDRTPFEVEVDFNTAETNTGNRGFCLNYNQILC